MRHTGPDSRYYNQTCFFRTFRFNRLRSDRRAASVRGSHAASPLAPARMRLIQIRTTISRMLTLATFLILLLAGSAVTVALTMARPRHALPGAVVALAITTLLWLLALGQIPQSYTASASLVPAAGFTWTWHVGRPLWMLSLALFLLQLGALLYLNAPAAMEQRARQARIVVLLGAAAHLAFWSSSLPALVASWSLLALLWGMGRWEYAGERFNIERAVGRTGLSLGAIFLLWLGAAIIPGPDQTADAGIWPTLTTTLALLAIVVQLALAPLALRQIRSRHRQSNLPLLLSILPGAAGAALLLRLEAVSDIGLAFALPLTLAGLFALLWAGRLAWSAAGGQEPLAPALIVAQTGLVLLAGVWTTPQAAVAEARVLLLGGGLLALVSPTLARDDDEVNISHRVAVAARLLALAALLGLPLTAGFQGRAALYSVWVDEGRWLLIAVTALLHLPLAAAGLVVARQSLQSVSLSERLERRHLPRVAGLILPAAGLLGVAALTEASIPAWLAVLAPVALAWPLARFLPEAEEVERTMRQAFQLQLPSGALVRRVGRGAGLALREAALILEGESGLLWLLLFLVILWLAR